MIVGSIPARRKLFSFWQTYSSKFLRYKKTHFWYKMLSVMHKKLSNDLLHMFHTNYEFMVKIILYRTVWKVLFFHVQFYLLCFWRSCKTILILIWWGKCCPVGSVVNGTRHKMVTWVVSHFPDDAAKPFFFIKKKRATVFWVVTQKRSRARYKQKSKGKENCARIWEIPSFINIFFLRDKRGILRSFLK